MHRKRRKRNGTSRVVEMDGVRAATIHDMRYGIEGTLKRVKPSDGDLLVFRSSDLNQSNHLMLSERLNILLSRLNVKPVVLMLTEKSDVELLPYRTARAILKAITRKHKEQKNAEASQKAIESNKSNSTEVIT